MTELDLIQNQRARCIKFIGAACGLGANHPGCEYGPDALRSFSGGLERSGLHTAWEETLHPAGVGNLTREQTVAEFCTRLAQRVSAVVSGQALPVVLGGDHSCAVGTWSGVFHALQQRGPYGLIWVDAHLDSHTPDTSPTGNLHGMPLACLLGFGPPHLTHVFGPQRKLLPQHVCVVGARSYEDEEMALLRYLGVRVYAMSEINRRGLDAIFSEALGIVQNGTIGFGVSIDLDVLDPEDAPGVGTPVAQGMRTADLRAALQSLSGNPALLAVELAEYNPELDRRGATANAAIDLLQAILGDALQSTESLIAVEQQYGAHNYDSMPVVLTRGEGVYLWDISGNRYLDMMSAYSAVSHGHGHPGLLRALRAQVDTLAVTSRAYYNTRLPLFLQKLCELTGLDQAIPMNTGLEAVETALKAVRKWAYQIKGVTPGHAEIIACEGNFHGRSIAILAMSGEAQYRNGFGPFPPGFRLIPYGNAAALAAAITPHTAAFLVEPIQGEGGIIVPPQGYLAECARICREHNVLLICDEIQTGLGRTGRMLACEHENVRPDGVTLGKALGGGLLPVSAFVARHEVMQVFTPGDHGSTFGGNPLAAAVGLEALDLLLEERLAERAAELGSYFLQRLRNLRSPLIREVRGKGLFIGIEIDTGKVSARTVCESLLEHGILTKDAHNRVVRFAPPLIISKEQLDWAFNQIRRVFDRLDGRFKQAA